MIGVKSLSYTSPLPGWWGYKNPTGVVWLGTKNHSPKMNATQPASSPVPTRPATPVPSRRRWQILASVTCALIILPTIAITILTKSQVIPMPPLPSFGLGLGGNGALPSSPSTASRRRRHPNEHKPAMQMVMSVQRNVWRGVRERPWMVAAVVVVAALVLATIVTLSEVLSTSSKEVVAGGVEIDKGRDVEPEGILEDELDDWWTTGMPIAGGLLAAGCLVALCIFTVSHREKATSCFRSTKPAPTVDATKTGRIKSLWAQLKTPKVDVVANNVSELQDTLKDSELQVTLTVTYKRRVVEDGKKKNKKGEKEAGEEELTVNLVTSRQLPVNLLFINAHRLTEFEDSVGILVPSGWQLADGVRKLIEVLSKDPALELLPVPALFKDETEIDRWIAVLEAITKAHFAVHSYCQILYYTRRLATYHFDLSTREEWRAIFSTLAVGKDAIKYGFEEFGVYKYEKSQWYFDLKEVLEPQFAWHFLYTYYIWSHERNSSKDMRTMVSEQLLAWHADDPSLRFGIITKLQGQVGQENMAVSQFGTNLLDVPLGTWEYMAKRWLRLCYLTGRSMCRSKFVYEALPAEILFQPLLFGASTPGALADLEENGGDYSFEELDDEKYLPLYSQRAFPTPRSTGSKETRSTNGTPVSPTTKQLLSKTHALGTSATPVSPVTPKPSASPNSTPRTINDSSPKKKRN